MDDTFFGSFNEQSNIINHVFDKIYLINLKSRPDRLNNMLKKFKNLNITNIKVIKAINGKHIPYIHDFNHYYNQPITLETSHDIELERNRKAISSHGAWGYLLTWKKLLKHAIKHKYKKILVFDDDVLFIHNFIQLFQEWYNNILHLSKDWKILLLGATQQVKFRNQIMKFKNNKKYNFKNILQNNKNNNFKNTKLKLKNSLDKQPIYPEIGYFVPRHTDGSYAVGLDKDCFKRLISEIDKMNCPFDTGPMREMYKVFKDRCYVAWPHLVIADVSDSDIRHSRDLETFAKKLEWDMNFFLRKR